jgi:hypothetical protein
MPITTLRDYHETVVKRRIAKSGHCTTWSLVKRHHASETEGVILTHDEKPLKFSDNATLHFHEYVVVGENGDIHRSEYSFHYQRPRSEGSFFFRYERDPANAAEIIHEECHVHLNNIRYRDNELRFKTHSTSFAEVFDFIMKVFYNPDYAPPKPEPGQ